MKLNEQQILWLEALRSGRFPQGRYRLRSDPTSEGPLKYCCLGVAAHVCFNAFAPGVMRYRAHSSMLSLADSQELGLSPLLHGTLTHLNDLAGLSFEEIADDLERYWKSGDGLLAELLALAPENRVQSIMVMSQ